VKTTGTDLFVYGTLLFDEVVRALTDRTFRSVPACLPGYARCTILRNGLREAYPAIRPHRTGRVAGRLLLEVKDRSLRWIDRFESDPPDYQRCQVIAKCNDGREIQAFTYVARPSLIPFLEGEWSPEQFKSEHLDDYLTRVIPEVRRQTG